ncbi:MAG: PAS domain S-box protein, partial [Leptospiraceae bacterium]|nr:PAS domain S-box protein [Leptospiraceae bacterium]
MKMSNFNKKILLVEDMPVIALKMEAILRDFGYDVLIARTGESALELFFSDNGIHLVLMDIDLGKGISGIETAIRILEKKEIPIIFLTSYADNEVVEKVRGVTRYGYLLKESGDSVLRSTIEMALDLFESRLALERSQSTLTNLMDNLPGMAYRCKNDQEWTMEFVNRGCLPLTGYSTADFLEGNRIYFADIIHSEDRERVWNEVQDALNKKERFLLSYRIVSSTKETKWVLEQGLGIYSETGKVIALEGFIEDITTRKLAEEALVNSEEKLRSVIDASNDGIWEWNIVANLIIWSDKIYQMFQLAKQDFDGTFESVQNLVHPDDRKKFLGAVSDSISKNYPYKIEIRFQRGDGSYGFFLCNGQVERDQSGQAIRMIGSISDISERKFAEIKVLDSLRFVNTIIDLSPIGIITYKSTGECISANSAACQIVGTQPEQIQSQNFWDLVTVKNFDLTDSVKQAIESKKPAQIELHGVSTFGKEYWVHAYLELFTLEGQTNLLLLLYDIMEKRKSEEEMRKIEERYRLIAENSADVIWLLDPETREFKYVSPSIYNLRGFTQEEILKEKAGMAVTPKTAAHISEDITTRLEKFKNGIDEIYRDERQEFHKDGRILTLEVTTRFFHDAETGRVLILGVSRDITQRKEAENNLEREKDLLSITLRSIGDGVITTDIYGNIFIMNNAAEVLTGWTQDEARGRPIDEVFQIFNQLTKERFESLVKKVLERDNIDIKELPNQITLVSRSGKEYIIAVSWAPIRDKNSKIIGVVLVFRDITEKQKLIENALRSDKLSSLGILAGGIAHDFNNLLAGIFGYLDLAREVSSQDSKERIYLEKAIKAFNRAKDLTHQLITFSKGGTPFKQTGQIADLLKQSAEFAMSGSNVICKFEIAEDLHLSDFDENQIGQVIDNIVINALQSMPNGGSLTVRAKNLHVQSGEISILREGDYIWISFQDTGTGIPQSVLPN